MASSEGSGNPYAAPQVRLEHAGKGAWRRFWLGCAAWLLVLPAITLELLRLRPDWMVLVLTGVGVLWAGTIAWVVQAYRGRNVYRRFGVTLGSVIALTVCFLLGAAMMAPYIFARPIVVTLPARDS